MSASGPTGTGAGTRPDVTLKLSQLQNLCKRDPPAYRDDYDAQVRRLESEASILALSPSSDPSPRLAELIQFAANVSSSSYKGKESERVAGLLIDLLLGQSSSSSSGDGAESYSTYGSGGGGRGGKGSKKKVRAPATEFAVSIPPSALHLHRDVRKSSVSALIVMRNKGAVEPLRLLELFFRVMACVPDKALREQLYRHVVNDVRNVNKNGRRDERVNRAVQSFLHRVVSSSGTTSTSDTASDLGSVDGESSTDIAAKRAVDMVAELYRRGVWTDERTVAIVDTAARSPNASVMAKAARFFLGIEERMAEDKRRKDDDEWTGANTVDYHKHSKKTVKRARRVAKDVKIRAKAQKKRELAGMDELATMELDKGVDHSRKLYPAIELVRDPQGLAEAIFRKVRRSGSNSYRFEIKLLMINFLTRLVGNHSLLLLPLYPYLRKYMGGHQRDVTAILAYAVQACHDEVPPDEVHGLLKTIAHEFVSERCSEEQMAVGINAARAICARVPSALSTEDEAAEVSAGREGGGSGVVMDAEAFARDLAAYAKHRDKSVSAAGKAWANFVREVHPALLAGKDRGARGTALARAGTKPLRYGETRAESGVEGAELLAEYEARKAEMTKKRREERGDGAPGDDESSDDEGEWEEPMNDEAGGSDVEGEEWVEVENDDDDDEKVEEGDDDEEEDFVKMGDDGSNDEDAEKKEEAADDDEEEEAPDLLPVKEVDGKMVPLKNDEKKENTEDDSSNVSCGNAAADLTAEERDRIRAQVSSTRVFTTEDFDRMRRLVEREERAKRDPRAAARRKRALAKGNYFEKLSDDDDSDGSDGAADSDDEDRIRIRGAVRPDDIMALSRRKRQSKAERLEKVLEGRQKFEAKGHGGGTSNAEKRRKKNFVMTKHSQSTRHKSSGLKETAKQARKRQKGGKVLKDAKKRRRKV